MTVYKKACHAIELPTEAITFTEGQEAEARRWMVEHPLVELKNKYNELNRWNPEEARFEWSSGVTSWGATKADHYYPYTYMPANAEPKTVTLEEASTTKEAWIIHPLNKTPYYNTGEDFLFYCTLKDYVEAGHKLYATHADVELALKLGWS